ncbi:MAG: rhodanese-like domain-containing protein [bacterium]|nr:rhodanese-like domain-containing protein [bacterium]
MRSSRVRASFAGAALAVTLVLAGCGGAAPSPRPGAVTLSADDTSSISGHVNSDLFLAATQGDEVTLIDVRTPEEFASGHLPGAVNIDVQSATFAAEIAELDREGTYALYCRSATRSRIAESAMIADGFERVFGLDGGVSDLDPGILVTN